MSEAWRNFKWGDPVVVSAPVGEEDRKYAGRHGVFVRYSNPHGYAVVSFGAEFTIFLHPESLTPDTSPEAQHVPA